MRRTMLLLATMSLTLLLSGVALAATRIGDNGPNFIVGTNQGDTLLGRGGNDGINGKGGKDEVLGEAGHDTLTGGYGDDVVDGGEGDDDIASDSYGPLGPSGSGTVGNDTLLGGEGNDFLFASDGIRDTLICGDGWDLVDPDSRDIVAADCEERGVTIIFPTPR